MKNMKYCFESTYFSKPKKLEFWKFSLTLLHCRKYLFCLNFAIMNELMIFHMKNAIS